MASLPHHKNKVIYDDITINRVDGVSKTLDIVCKLYLEDDMIEETKQYNDENGDIQTYTTWNYETSPHKYSWAITYNIPTEHQTALSKGTTHPHNSTEELEFQSKWNSWVEGYKASEEYITAISDLNSKVL